VLFLIWDVLVHAYEPVDAALGRFRDRAAGIGPALGYGALFLLGISAGLLSLVYYERWLAARRRPRRFGPGAMAAGPKRRNRCRVTISTAPAAGGPESATAAPETLGTRTTDSSTK
jgi:zinc transporter, ZIP family